MIYPSDFALFVLEARRWPEEQKVMARLALNFLFDPEQYPVDLSETLGLHSDNRIMVNAFLAACGSFPNEASTWEKEDMLCHALIDLTSKELLRDHAKTVISTTHTFLPLSNFVRYFQQANRNKSLLARIALNSLGHAQSFPVDVSELRFLSEANRSAILTLLTYAARTKPLPDDALILDYFRPSAA